MNLPRRLSLPILLLGTLLLSGVGVLSGPLAAQEEGPRWERRNERVQPPPTTFHSTQGINLPTTETLAQGEFLFEISHRFQPPISEAEKALWGLDGPVRLRLGLAWAAHDRFMVGVQRSNLDDNLDLFFKGRFWEGDLGSVAVAAGVQAGVAWNTEVIGATGDPDDRQLHAAAILDAVIGDRVGVGLVPNWVSNPDVRADGEDDAIGLGVLGQLYLTEQFSLLGEWTSGGDDVPGLGEDALSLGVELETGGHFFKIVVGNSVRLNPAQHLAGAAAPVAMDQLRLGFNVTRVLAF